jgi:hypothetical protein
VIVDRLEVLRLDHVGIDQRIGIHGGGDVAHDVLNEFGIIVGALGDPFLIRALQQAEQFTGSLVLNLADQILDPQEAVGACGDLSPRNGKLVK